MKKPSEEGIDERQNLSFWNRVDVKGIAVGRIELLKFFGTENTDAQQVIIKGKTDKNRKRGKQERETIA